MRKYKLKVNDNPYEVEIKSFEGQNAVVEINGVAYNVEIDTEIKTTKTPTLVRSQMPQPSAPSALTRSGALSKIIAPLPGNIVKVLVKVGDRIKKEDMVMVMEAMKMENNIFAETEGVVKSIKANVGSTVLQGDLLMEIE